TVLAPLSKPRSMSGVNRRSSLWRPSITPSVRRGKRSPSRVTSSATARSNGRKLEHVASVRWLVFAHQVLDARSMHVAVRRQGHAHAEHERSTRGALFDLG